LINTDSDNLKGLESAVDLGMIAATCRLLRYAATETQRANERRNRAVVDNFGGEILEGRPVTTFIRRG